MNTQPPLPIRDHISSMDGILQIHSIFRTIQGEGPFVGRPAIFVRMFGCNLQCPACDTDYTSKTTMRNRVPQIVEYIQENMLGYSVMENSKRRPLVVITGGEPLRQDIREFCKALLKTGIAVQIETNGTVEADLSEVFGVASVFSYPMTMFQVVVSPKTAKIAQAAGEYATAYKYILAADSVDSEDGLPTRSLEMRQRPARPLVRGTAPRPPRPEVYVQPMDAHDPETNQKNIQAAVNSCMTFGYRLSLQTHKILNLP